MKGLFIPGITAEMLRNGCLEGIEALMAEGEIYDIDYTGWIPVSEMLPMIGEDVLFCDSKWVEEGCLRADGDWWMFRWSSTLPKEKIIAWRPLPEPYKESDGE